MDATIPVAATPSAIRVTPIEKSSWSRQEVDPISYSSRSSLELDDRPERLRPRSLYPESDTEREVASSSLPTQKEDNVRWDTDTQDVSSVAVGESEKKRESNRPFLRSNRFLRDFQRFDAGDVPFPSYHTSKTSSASRFPNRWIEVEEAKIDEPLHAPRMRRAPRKRRLLAELKNQRGRCFRFWSTICSCLLCCFSCCRRDEEFEKEVEAERLEEASEYNLSYQDLGDDFQISQLRRVLRTLPNARSINLSHNRLYNSLSNIILPSCEVLNVSYNEFTSLQDLPTCPKLIVLQATHNHFKSLNGLDRFPNLQEISLDYNPVYWDPDYSFNIRKTLSRIEVIDDEIVGDS